MRYLGIDYGTKKVGVALSDESGSMGFPRAVLANDPSLMRSVQALIDAESVGAVVVGESLDFSGRENPVAKAARAFGDALASASGLPVYFEPEALTTKEAERMREREAKSRKPKDRSPVDASAAALILTSYLSRPQ